VKVFVGITGASGAPYAARLLELLAGEGCEIGLCISDPGVRVLATELYGDSSLGRDEVTARLTGSDSEGVRVYAPDDYNSPFASGSGRTGACVVCPCSMSSAGQIAAGAGSNLIHRAAAVALKEERPLVLVPRETPLSAVHLEALLRLRHAGAGIVFAAPSFYGMPATVSDLVDSVVARVLDRLEIEHELGPRWGEERA
jgi:4-hydroxy-3-polyprenylbenzoate decarboxylase